MRGCLQAWPTLALVCGLPRDRAKQLRFPNQRYKRATAAGAPPYAMRFVVAVRVAPGCGLTRARDLIIDSAPILAWYRRDPDATSGHAPAHYPTAFPRGYRAHTLLCRGSGLPLFVVAPANGHDAPFAKLLLTRAVRLDDLRPRRIRMDAAYWELARIHRIRATLGAVAVVPWHPRNQQNRDCRPPTRTIAELGKRGSIKRFFGRVLRFFGLQRPPGYSRTALVQRVTLTYAATIVGALAAHHADGSVLIRTPKRVLAHRWEGEL